MIGPDTNKNNGSKWDVSAKEMKKEKTMMLSKEKLEKIFNEALKNANGFEKTIEMNVQSNNVELDVAVAGFTVGLLQMIYRRSAVGSAVEDLGTAREIFLHVLGKAEEKFEGWDKKRAAKLEDEAKKISNDFFKQMKEGKDKDKRDAGDNLN